MTQILVTLNEDVGTRTIRRAIELLRGVASTSVMRTRSLDTQKTLAQQKYVKDSLGRAFEELKVAQQGGKELKSLDDFIEELKTEQTA